MDFFDPTRLLEFKDLAGESIVYANIRECVCRDIAADVINTDFAKEVIRSKITFQFGVGRARKEGHERQFYLTSSFFPTSDVVIFLDVDETANKFQRLF